MQSRGRGRPRGSTQVRPGESIRNEILDAAGELITTQGFGAATTRQIADAVGVRQNAIYYHFPSKEAILGALLEALVTPALDAARALDEIESTDGIDFAARLFALARFDAQVLAGWRWNLGVLFSLPEARSPEFATVLGARLSLRDHYVAFAVAVTDQTGAAPTGDMTFRLAESVSSMRADNALPADAPERIARSCLLLTGWTTQHDEVQARAAALLTSSIATQDVPGFQ
ncbi:TetR/AcrR family transcriptional regulator [Nocardia tengchongensis]|uniref:TetR/AcrR family transcriptional regulator n=1 Tax=Nocardia tengchongensis TaxID=2055889 RepID=UPI0036C3577E